MLLLVDTGFVLLYRQEILKELNDEEKQRKKQASSKSSIPSSPIPTLPPPPTDDQNANNNVEPTASLLDSDGEQRDQLGPLTSQPQAAANDSDGDSVMSTYKNNAINDEIDKDFDQELNVGTNVSVPVEATAEATKIDATKSTIPTNKAFKKFRSFTTL